MMNGYVYFHAWWTQTLCTFSAAFLKGYLSFYTIVCVVVPLAVDYACFELSYNHKQVYRCCCLRKSLIWTLLCTWSRELYFLDSLTCFYQNSNVKLCLSKSQIIPEVCLPTLTFDPSYSFIAINHCSQVIMFKYTTGHNNCLVK